ncbi:MAG: hypothetical protein ICV62_14640 [Cyanobacteria bacterium Co-bin13]|nr:hypothetical protein [Cyanobacteria bacterium Co-bin13]
MKLQRSTVVLIGIALLLGAGVLVSETQRSRSPSQAELTQSAEDPIFGFAESDVVSLVVERDGETLAFERDDQNTWQMVQPVQAPAEEGAVAFLLSRLTADAPVQELTLTPDQQAEFGFTPPSGTVRLTLADGTTHTLVLGGKDFSGTALYALIDPEQVPLPENAGEVPLYVVSIDVANGVERPLAEWQIATDAPASTPTSDSAENPAPSAGEAAQDSPAAAPGAPAAVEEEEGESPPPAAP